MKSMTPFVMLALALGFVTACGGKSDNSDSGSSAVPDGGITISTTYGPVTSRQLVNLYLANTQAATPLFLWSHGNGGSYNDTPTALIAECNNKGVSVISWESLTSVDDSAGLQLCWDDMEVLIQWLNLPSTKSTYNIDPSRIIVGGSSRGTGASWPYAQSKKPEVKGIYMQRALGEAQWSFPDYFVPTDYIDVNSPPIVLVYLSSDIDTGRHSTMYGWRIINDYTSKGVPVRHELNTVANTDLMFQWLPAFIDSVF